ncbi:MAG: CBS domain-containing protein [Pseudomonadales bacterium]|nr:CBS domain-containing protein [Pseudomonadales bacterium]
MLKIKDLLTNKGHAVWSVAPDDTVYDAIALMSEKGIGALCVVHEEKLIGIISERDYARSIILQGRRSRETPVKEIMTGQPITITPEHKVDECLSIMTEKRIRHLPVIQNGYLVGVVSIGDLVKTIIQEQSQLITQLEHYIKS